jgi:hypothetical protein
MAHQAAANPRQTFLVESYHPGLGEAELTDLVSRLREAVAEMSRDGQAISHVRSTIVASDEAFLCLITATFEELIQDAFARADSRSHGSQRPSPTTARHQEEET